MHIFCCTFTQKRREMKKCGFLAMLAIMAVALMKSPKGVRANPIRGDSKAGAFYYLVNFGYIEGSKNGDTAALLNEDVLTKAIKKFQVSNLI